MTAAEMPWDERPAARFDPDDPYACPWECDPPAWDEPAPEPCRTHTDRPSPSCIRCPSEQWSPEWRLIFGGRP